MADFLNHYTGRDMDMERLARALDGLACAADPEFDDSEGVLLGPVSSTVSGLAVGESAEVTLELTYTVSGATDDALINPIWFREPEADDE